MNHPSKCIKTLRNYVTFKQLIRIHNKHKEPYNFGCDLENGKIPFQKTNKEQLNQIHSFCSRRKFLQRANASKEFASASGPEVGSATDATAAAAAQLSKSTTSTSPTTSSSTTTTSKPHDPFDDLREFVEKGEGVVADEGVVRISGEDEADNPSIAEVKRIKLRWVSDDRFTSSRERWITDLANWFTWIIKKVSNIVWLKL